MIYELIWNQLGTLIYVTSYGIIAKDQYFTENIK